MRARWTNAALLVALSLSVLNLWMLFRIMGLLTRLAEILYLGGR